jgi:hypothetical protein
MNMNAVARGPFAQLFAYDAPSPESEAPKVKRGDGVITKTRNEGTVNKIQRRLDSERSARIVDDDIDPVEATRCIALYDDDDPDLPDCGPMHHD